MKEPVSAPADAPMRRCADAPMRRCADAPMRRCADAPMVRPLNSSRKQKTDFIVDIIGAFCIANSGRCPSMECVRIQIVHIKGQYMSDAKATVQNKVSFPSQAPSLTFYEKALPSIGGKGRAECAADQSWTTIHRFGAPRRH
ncbi:hypothetical protein [Roseobacter sp. HKCCD8269]|uniref:hypothetical protein n=2 Tax=unclassified Roseobacter TaxID=196798 RepID=UPI001491E671|nr:hypothetical protein [Roseobacter sp. HKCCD8269]